MIFPKRETTLHALRGIITPAGDKMSEPVKKQVYTTLISLLGSQEDTTRNCAAGCLGAICKWLSAEQLDATLMDHILSKIIESFISFVFFLIVYFFLDDDSGMDWMLRQGRGAALSVTLKETPDTIWTDQYKIRLVQTILSQLAADKVSVTQTAVRSCGYLLQYLMLNDQNLPSNLLGPFVRVSYLIIFVIILLKNTIL